MAKVSLRVYNQEIEAMIDRGQLDEAIAHCKHILKTFPKHLETYRLLGKAYLEYKRYPDTADVFSRVLVGVPNDFVANVGMSIINDEQNNLDKAIWHMERAFETQPSNAAIQSELQRLYGRREGVQPPRIRMTRGALAHMYVQGELYPQAISEIRGVLKEDPERVDMQVLLARAYFKSGLKNDAAEVASAVLRTDPYCLDANRVLVEILSVDHPESVQTYRQRVVELDPYAAQVTGSIFSSDEVPNMAVTLERLDWDGQSVETQPDWQAQPPVSLESSPREDEPPDWLTGNLSATPAPSQPAAVPAFDAAPPPAMPAEPAEEIPDFLRAAGWGTSSGAFDESKSAFADESEPPAGAAQPIEQGDLPDWVKAMAPPQQPAAPAEEEELPDWINKIGTSALPVSSEPAGQPDWMKPPEQPAQEEPDWLKSFGASEQPASTPAASNDQPDWLKSFANETEAAPAAAPGGDLDWLSQLTGESESQSGGAAGSDADFLKGLGSQPEAAAPSAGEFDFLNELTKETEQPAPAANPPTPPAAPVAMSAEDQDDTFAWLEGLAAKQGATEGLLTKPEERLQEEPDWIKQVKAADTTQTAVPQPPMAQPPAAPQPPVAQPPAAQPPAPSANLEQLGKTEQERDDSFAWLESLAAKQGATEGLLTKPEERLEKEPDWIQQAKTQAEQTQQTPAAQPTQEHKPAVTEPTPKVEELGKSQQEQDDSFAWLESLAAKQGATEGLLTKPEERLAEEPDWVKQAKDVEAPQPPAPAPEQPVAMDDTAAWLRSLDQEEPAPAVSSIDETSAWLKSLDEPEAAAPTPVESALAPEAPSIDETSAWLKSLDEPEVAAPKPAEAGPADELPAWMQSVAEEQPPVAEPIVPEPARAQPVTPEPPKPETGSLPSWLSGLDQEKAQEPATSDEGLPAWLRDDTGEVLAEPTRIEPTRPTDWQPVEARKPEPEPEASAPQSAAPEPLAPEPVVPQPPAQPVPAQVVQEQPKKPAPAPKPAREPAVRKAPEPSTSVEPILGEARHQLSLNNIPDALESYSKLIKKGRFLEEVIHDLREALYRYPVEVSIWQSLGDAYMRANRLQDALDSYTKAEELLR